MKRCAVRDSGDRQWGSASPAFWNSRSSAFIHAILCAAFWTGDDGHGDTSPSRYRTAEIGVKVKKRSMIFLLSRSFREAIERSSIISMHFCEVFAD
jgi:hypothetical protein